MKLNEYKNINDKVVWLSQRISDRIISDTKVTSKKKSRISGAIYTENCFNIDVSDIFIHMDTLNVCYVLYNCSEIGNYNLLMQILGGEANSYSDYENREIKIVSGFINGVISPDFLQTIMHEINHLFEYDNGREKKVDLYDKVVKLAMNDDTDVMMTARALYYSFRHERDAFVHQFYGFLCQEKPKLTYSELLNYSEYKNAKRCYDYVISNQNSPKVNETINMLGFHKRDFIKRIKFGLNSLERKLANAYMRFQNEQFKINGHSIRLAVKQEFERIEESKEYGEDLTWGIESIFEF